MNVTAHILRNTRHTLRAELPVDTPAAGLTVTITITRADGTVIVTAAACTDAGAGTYTYLLDDQYTTTLDLLTCTWTVPATGESYTTYAEVVGGHLFSVADARTYRTRGAQCALASTADYPTVDIEEARARITDLFEEYCGVAFTPRYARVSLPGSGSRTLGVPHHRVTALIAASISGTAQTAAHIVPLRNSRQLHHTTGIWSVGSDANPQNCAVAYEHGWTQTPGDIKRAALIVLLREIVPSDIPDGALSFSTSDGTFRIASPGPNTPTGIPVVDEALNRYRYESLI